MEKGKLGSGPVRSLATSVCVESERAPFATRREAKTFLHKTARVQNRCAAPEIPVAVGGAKPAARDHTANISAVCRRNAAVAPRGFIDGQRFLPPAGAGRSLSSVFLVGLSRRSERERMRVCPECGGESSSRTDEGLLVCDLCGMTLQQVAVHVTAAARVANCDLTAVEQGEEKNEDDDMLVCRV